MRYQDRQHRPQAYNELGHAFELTFSCYRKSPFLTEQTSLWLADSTRKACRKLNYPLRAYVFMPDPVHLMIWPRDRRCDDSVFLKAIKVPTSRRAVGFLCRKAPAWLEKFRVRRGAHLEHHFWQSGRGMTGISRHPGPCWE